MSTHEEPSTDEPALPEGEFAWHRLVGLDEVDGALPDGLENATDADVKGASRMDEVFFRWFSEEAVRNDGSVTTAPAGDKQIIAIDQPIGISLLITPWNFPAAMITRKAGPALAVGCTIVIKPAKETPLSALALAELADRAGIPAGVINVVCGSSSRAIGGEMTGNPSVRKLTFTGSTEIGKLLVQPKDVDPQQLESLETH